MKQLFIAGIIISFFSSCDHGSKKNEKERVRKVIQDYFVKKRSFYFQNIDSAVVTTVDSLTERTATVMYMAMVDTGLKKTVEYISSYKEAITMDSEDVARGRAPVDELGQMERQLVGEEATLASLANCRDSLQKIYNHTNTTDLYGWRANVQLYWRDGGKGQTSTEIFFVDRNDSVQIVFLKGRAAGNAK
jgi:hypothetical protein